MTRPDQDPVPVADAAEQAADADPAAEPTDGPVQALPGPEVSEWDAVEQATPVPQTDDDYR